MATMKLMIACLSLVLAAWLALSEPALACDTEEACWDAYAEAMVERDGPADFEAAGNALRDGCSQSETGYSCRILATMIRRAIVSGRPEEVPALTEHACSLGDDLSCNWMAERLLTSSFWSDPRPADYAEKRALVEQECSDGNDFACRKLVRYVTEDSIPRYRAWCDAGQQTFCAILGGRFIYPNYDQIPKAEATFRDTCEAGNGMGCIFLADLISSGNGSDFNETSAPHMERACDLGIVHGCNVARDYMLAKDPEASAAKRLRYLRPACEAGYLPACLRETQIERMNTDTTKIRYAMTLRTSCLEGNWQSCDKAAYAFRGVAYQMELNKVYKDVDQLYQNYFDLAEVLKGGG